MAVDAICLDALSAHLAQRIAQCAHKGIVVPVVNLGV